MSTTVFGEEASVFFVGGRGDASGCTQYAGGCTKGWWDGECPNDTEAEKAAAMAKLMGIDGEPIIDVASASYTETDGRISMTNIGAGVEVGMVAYVVESGVPDVNVDTGRYVVTAIDVDDDWIECGGIEGNGDASVDVVIGGAFDSLQNGLDDTDAGYHSVWIHTNLDETLSASVDVDSGGDAMRNTFKRVAGYKTVAGDLGRGGSSYRSAIAILQAGSIDSASCVTLDANSNGFDVLNVGVGVSNLVFENLHITGTTGNAIEFADSNSVNIALRNCRFSDMACAIISDISHVLFDSCYSHDDLTWTPYFFSGGGANCVVLNCVSRISVGNVVCWQQGSSGAAIGNISVGGNFGYRVSSAGQGSGAVVVGNTSYAGISCGVLLDGGDGAVVFDNIFCLSPGAVGIYSRNGGSAVYNDYNCFIETDGTPLAPVGSEYSGGEVPAMGAHSLAADCDFVDAANGDFRVRNADVLRGGKPAPDDKAGVMGALGQEYQFARRARVMNAGRLGIVR